jgi:hypothetical protein
MMTAGILAELKAPVDGSALDEFLPLAPMLDPQRTQPTTAGGEPAEIPDDIFYSQYEGIGNWLLRDWDWNSDMTW